MTSMEPNGTALAARSNGESMKPRDIATRSIAGVLVPDTPLISRAIEYARVHSESYLFNHVMRSWLFAVSIARQRKVAHDAEVLAVATLLHDLGLAKAFSGPLRFEVEGANAARRFAQSESVDGRRAQLIWDGVALNSTPSLGLHKEIEVALAKNFAGSALDGVKVSAKNLMTDLHASADYRANLIVVMAKRAVNAANA